MWSRGEFDYLGSKEGDFVALLFELIALTIDFGLEAGECLFYCDER